MKSIRSRVLAALLVALTAGGSPVTAWAWGCDGHETIARIAERHLGAHARRVVSELLDPAPIDAHLQRFCHTAADSALANASTWADDVRSDETSRYFGTGPWHFIDVPRGAAPGALSPFCPQHSGCIVTAITDELARLRGNPVDRRATAETLMLLVHLVGDLHQPLHCATNGDAGGNCVPVTYFGVAPQLLLDRADNAVYQPNLHAVWDTGILRKILGRRSTTWLADTLERRFRAQIPLWQQMRVDPDAWAWESHRAAERVAYGQLPVPIPITPPGQTAQCGDVSPRMLALHERLGQRYQDAAAPVIEEQLAKAGIRLAVIMNRIWP